MVSENGREAEDTQESDNDTENDSEETESNSHKTSTTFHSKNPCEHCENSNVYGTLIMKCPNCSRHDSFHQIPEERNNMKEGFLRCHDCGAIVRLLVARACSSMFCITISATTTETGEPIAVTV